MEALMPGGHLPAVSIALVGGSTATPGTNAGVWELLVVYRGRHCPRCKTYLDKLQGLLPKLRELGVEVLAVSADPVEKAEADIAEFGWTFPLGYNLAIADMHHFGLYVSDPAQAGETDRPFAEPGIFVINPDNQIQVLSTSNAASCRPDLDVLAHGIEMAITKNMPIRGRRAA